MPLQLVLSRSYVGCGQGVLGACVDPACDLDVVWGPLYRLRSCVKVVADCRNRGTGNRGQRSCGTRATAHILDRERLLP